MKSAHDNVLFFLQCAFMTMALWCMIALIWYPIFWIQFLVTAVALLFAGVTCKAARK